MGNIRYKKFKGWNGKIYLVQMSQAEIEVRRKLGVVLGIFTMVPVMILLMALAAGLVG